MLHIFRCVTSHINVAIMVVLLMVRNWKAQNMGDL